MRPCHFSALVGGHTWSMGPTETGLGRMNVNLLEQPLQHKIFCSLRRPCAVWVVVNVLCMWKTCFPSVETRRVREGDLCIRRRRFPRRPSQGVNSLSLVPSPSSFGVGGGYTGVPMTMFTTRHSGSHRPTEHKQVLSDQTSLSCPVSACLFTAFAVPSSPAPRPRRRSGSTS
jgi:hypothetical protein